MSSTLAQCKWGIQPRCWFVMCQSPIAELAPFDITYDDRPLHSGFGGDVRNSRCRYLE